MRSVVYTHTRYTHRYAEINKISTQNSINKINHTDSVEEFKNEPNPKHTCIKFLCAPLCHLPNYLELKVGRVLKQKKKKKKIMLIKLRELVSQAFARLRM